jgi:TolB-like protein/Tfp pilus assembly protein PilF/tRNA A-37 threonylcarbamoyl transferase component Bud32
MSNDLRTHLEANLGASYTIEGELGGGGMARVFVATERALGRRVVIKVLSPELAAEVSAKRFEREIRLAASLQQANIVPVLSAGETNGVPHYTMPFVEGRSLRDRLLADGRLPIGEAISILRDVARALAYAHERGVVHRDIKPENVLLSGDAAVVTDFGIAKAISSARVAEGGASRVEGTVTQIGTSVGTPAYMAPEQISADPTIDHRADIYSFGCLAYELVSGKPPFADMSVQGLFAAHLSERPADVLDRNPDAPPALAALIEQCLEKDPARRPQTAKDILGVLERVTTTSGGVVRLVRRVPRRARRLALGLAAVAIVGAGWRIAATLGALSPPPSVVVIPFLNAGGDSADAYLAEGIADGLATALGKVSGVKVAARSLGYQYRDRSDVDARTIGTSLGVSHVLRGSLRRAGNRLRVNAYLTRASDNLEVWSQSYDRSVMDAFVVQDEITRLVAGALPRQLRPGDVALPATANSGTSNAEAYDLYSRGRYLLQRRGRGVRQAARNLSEAIAKDSNFARAHAAYALALELLPYFEWVNADSLGRLAVPAARRALAMDSTLSEAHTALAMAYQHRYQWQMAEAAYRHAISVEPPDADAYIQYGRFLWYTRTAAEALPLFQRARELDPHSAVASGWLGRLLDYSGRHAEGMAEVRRALEIDSTVPPTLVMMASMHLRAGQHDSARAYAERLWRVYPQWRSSAAAIFAELGDRARALAVAGDLEGTPRIRVNAGIYAALKDSTRWFETTERATRAGEIWPTYASLNEPNLDFMRSSARFAKIVLDVGLDTAIFTAPTGGRPR